MTWHDKRLPSFSFWQIITCHDGKPFDLPWVWRIFHDVSRMLHPDSPHLTMISTFFSVWQMKQKALLIPSHYLQDSNFLTFFLTQSTRFIKASMVEITLPSSKLRSCAEAGRSIAEEMSTKERHCLRAAEGGWKPPTKMGLRFLKIATKENPSWVTVPGIDDFSYPKIEWDGKKRVAEVKKLKKLDVGFEIAESLRNIGLAAVYINTNSQFECVCANLEKVEVHFNTQKLVCNLRPTERSRCTAS